MLSVYSGKVNISSGLHPDLPRRYRVDSEENQNNEGGADEYHITDISFSYILKFTGDVFNFLVEFNNASP
jgi:hypothetical protein